MTAERPLSSRADPDAGCHAATAHRATASAIPGTARGVRPRSRVRRRSGPVRTASRAAATRHPRPAAGRRPRSRCPRRTPRRGAPPAASRRRPRGVAAPRGRQRLAVRPGRGHRRERVADGEDARDQRDVLAGQAVEVAVAVPALVVMPDAGPDDLDVGQVADDEVAERDVLLDDVVLVLGQACRACGGCGPGRRSCRRRGGGRRRGSWRRSRLEAEPPAEEDAVAGDILGVLLRVAILRVDREDQALEDVERARLGLRLGRSAGHPDGVAAARARLLERHRHHRQERRHGLGVVRVEADAGADRQRQPLRGVELERMVGQRGAQTPRGRRSSTRPIRPGRRAGARRVRSARRPRRPGRARRRAATTVRIASSPASWP